MPPLTERVNFARIVTVLAIVFGIALGSCGITAAIALGGARLNQGFAGALMFLGYAELAVMVLSAVALVIVVAVWIIASMLGRFNHRDAETVRLFHQDESKKDDDPR